MLSELEACNWAGGLCQVISCWILHAFSPHLILLSIIGAILTPAGSIRPETDATLYIWVTEKAFGRHQNTVCRVPSFLSSCPPPFILSITPTPLPAQSRAQKPVWFL